QIYAVLHERQQSMLPREVVEEFVGRRCAPGLYVLKTVADPLKGLLIILALPFEVFSQGVVERVGGALSAPARNCSSSANRLSLKKVRPPKDCNEEGRSTSRPG